MHGAASKAVISKAVVSKAPCAEPKTVSVKAADYTDVPLQLKRKQKAFAVEENAHGSLQLKKKQKREEKNMYTHICCAASLSFYQREPWNFCPVFGSPHTY